MNMMFLQTILAALLLQAIFIEANVFETAIEEPVAANSDGTCRNNREWTSDMDNTWDCGDIQFVESRRLELCQLDDVHNNCPISCGVCCEDDPDYTFERDNGMTSGCDWLTLNNKNEENRLSAYCDTFNSGIMVRAACPKACGYCFPYVSLPPSSNPTVSTAPTVSPSSLPTTAPSLRPTLSNGPTHIPSTSPSYQPSMSPNDIPSVAPSITTNPSGTPSDIPSLSILPTSLHSQAPSLSNGPSAGPSHVPSASMSPTATFSTVPSLSTHPTSVHSQAPSLSNGPSTGPSHAPSASMSPTATLSTVPSGSPSDSLSPSASPSFSPSASTSPSVIPSGNPSESVLPTAAPSFNPSISLSPSDVPSNNPSVSMTPSASPSLNPSLSLSPSVSMAPTLDHSHFPSLSNEPSAELSQSPSVSVAPSAAPSSSPSASTSPSVIPSSKPSKSTSPTAAPSFNPSMSLNPSDVFSNNPSVSMAPSVSPSLNPSMSLSPSGDPSHGPSMSISPSSAPSPSPSASISPSGNPSGIPSVSSAPSAVPSSNPSGSSSPTINPSQFPSLSLGPSTVPSATPSVSLSPSTSPSLSPSLSMSPSLAPTEVPTDSKRPSVKPSTLPTLSVGPSTSPTVSPSKSPSKSPTLKPSPSPTSTPTSSPTLKPSPSPTSMPTSSPTAMPSSAPSENKPNLIMILTDEHNLRTLSVYRNYLLTKHSKEKVDVWGDVQLSTPNIDSLATDGALFTNFYTVSPLCTPSRASFMTGLYPPFTGAADQNNGKLHTSVKTFADILRDERGYTTSYMGKFHLDGEEKPGWGAPDGREFGFDDNTYRYNRGHWKYFDEVNGKVKEYEMDGEANFEGSQNEHFATDFLVNRGMTFIENASKNKKPFALVLSIPDPHSPNENRPFYRNMFQDLDFKVPETARKNMKFDPAAPGFNYFDKEEVPLDTVDDFIADYEQNFFVNHMQQYYGMVKCIDYNIGKLLAKIKDLGIEDDTVVVFTSDHGDLLAEHGKLNKGRPYETSAGIPFIVKYPDRVPAGKIIETAYSSVDFAPTILSLMGVGELPSGVKFQGVDGSQELMSQQKITANDEQIIFSFETGNTPTWAAAIKNGYKLVVAKGDVPWLFDIYRDPDEMFNFATYWEHQDVFAELREAMIRVFKEYQVPLTEITKTIFLDMPSCMDSRDVMPINNGKIAFCTDIGGEIGLDRCDNQYKVSQHCPKSCNSCACEDSPGMMWVNSSGRRCETLQSQCDNKAVQTFCPKTCGMC